MNHRKFSKNLLNWVNETPDPIVVVIFTAYKLAGSGQIRVEQRGTETEWNLGSNESLIHFPANAGGVRAALNWMDENEYHQPDPEPGW